MQAKTLMNGVEGSSCCVIEVREKHSFLLAGSSDLGLGYVVKKSNTFLKSCLKLSTLRVYIPLIPALVYVSMRTQIVN